MFIRPTFGYIQTLGLNADVSQDNTAKETAAALRSDPEKSLYTAAKQMSAQYGYCDVGIIRTNVFSAGVTHAHLQKAILLGIPLEMIIRAQPEPIKQYNGQNLLCVEDVERALNIEA